MHTVAISGINATDNPGPGTGIAKSLKESDLEVRIIGLAYDSLEPGIVMDWIIDKSYILPYPSNETATYLNRLRTVVESEEVDIIIPSLDVELLLYIKKRGEIEAMGRGVKMLLPTKEALEQVSKKNLQAIADKIGLDFPKSKTVTSVASLNETTQELGYPVVVKGIFYDAYVCTNYTESLNAFNALASKWGYPIIVQEFIAGDEYNLIGLGDGQGGSLGHIMVKKMLITKAGKIWSNVTIINKELQRVNEKLLKATKWSSGYEIEMLWERKTNRFYLLEINPRFPSWIYLSAGCQVNLPQRLVQKVLGMPLETHSDYQAGKMLIRYTGEVIKDINYLDEINMY